MVGFVFAWVIIIAFVAFALLAVTSAFYIFDWIMEEICGVGFFEIVEDVCNFLLDKIIKPLLKR